MKDPTKMPPANETNGEFTPEKIAFACPTHDHLEMECFQGENDTWIVAIQYDLSAGTFEDALQKVG